jgi:phosphate/sulfate permease
MMEMTLQIWFSWTAKPTIGLAPTTSLLLEGRKQKKQISFTESVSVTTTTQQQQHTHKTLQTNLESQIVSKSLTSTCYALGVGSGGNGIGTWMGSLTSLFQ